MKKIKNYIAGILTTPYNSNYINNFNPATGEVYTMTPDSFEGDLYLATESAEKALPVWSNTPVEDRCNLMLWIADKIRKNSDKLALAECNDTGKPLWLIKSIDIPAAIKNLEYFASSAKYFASKSKSPSLQPYGFVGAISSMNLPLFSLTWKIVPALTTGNCVIVNPPVLSPMTACLFSELCIEAGLPDGVLCVLHGFVNKIGTAIVTNPKIETITFSGSAQTSSQITYESASKKIMLELGGKNPCIVFKDCNYNKMLESIIYSSYSNHGENNLGCSKIFIEKSLYEKFKKDFVEKAKNLKVGDPLENDTHVGAIVSKEYLDKVLLYIKSVKEEGAKILCGGSKAKIDILKSARIKNGLFFEPTVIEELNPNCELSKEDVLGPVVVLYTFDTEDDLAQLVSENKSGFASTIWTEDLKKAQRVATKLNTRIIWVNSWMLTELNTPYNGKEEMNLESGVNKALKFFLQ
ncbi:aldehyde dehydrogenase family protein [Bacteroidota bacterium]